VVAGRLFQEKETNMAGSPDVPSCSECYHDCHCESLFCTEPVGIGMSDKSIPCGCVVCKCTPNRSDLGQVN